MTSKPPLALVAGVLLCAAAAAADSAAPPQVSIAAALRFDAPEIEGTETIRWRNGGEAPATTLRLFLFANRFRRAPEWSDLSRHFLLAGARYAPGATELESVRAAGVELATRSGSAPHAGEGTVVVAELRDPVPPGAEVEIAVRFRTRLPNLYDAFQASDGLIVADGGWYPEPLALDGGAPSLAGPPSARTRVSLSAPGGSRLLLNGRSFEGGRPAELEVADGEAASFVLSRDGFGIERRRIGGRVVTVYTAPSRDLVRRDAHDAPPLDALLETMTAIVRRTKRPGDVTLVRLPLRWLPSRTASGMVLVSDRLFEIFPILRPLHQRELAYAVFLAEERAAARRRESAADAGWIAEGLAWRRAQSLYEEAFRRGREVKDWIRLFGVFAIVDRFETAPRIPLARAFFPVAAADDPLRLRPESAFEDRPAGRMIFARLRARLRPERFDALVSAYERGAGAFRALLADRGGERAVTFLDAWLRPYPRWNYALRSVERNPGGGPGARFSIARQGGDDRPDTIEVELAEERRIERAFVDVDGGSSAAADLRAASAVDAVTLDPDRTEIETRLDDNRRPAELQLLLDSADVEVSSTEFGVSTLLVGRRRYDYRKDLALAGFYTNRGYGADAGFQLHGGTPIDANLFRQNLFVYYSVEALDRSFENRRAPRVRTGGRLAGFGLRFNYYDPFWLENPRRSHHLRLFFDGFDRSVGSGFDFVQGGGSFTLTLPLAESTILASQVLNGFSASTSGRGIPNQGLFSLGGFRSIRGIGAEEKLAEDIFIVRAELRQLLPYRFDLDLEDLVILRRVQLKAFADVGNVSNAPGRVYDPSRYAVGVGAGVNLFYDFMGFFPTSFYLDVATRADRRAGAQVLFGVRQPF